MLKFSTLFSLPASEASARADEYSELSAMILSANENSQLLLDSRQLIYSELSGPGIRLYC